MTQTAAITEAITSLTDAHTRFGLARIEDEQFFPEWSEELPKLLKLKKPPWMYSGADIYITVAKVIC